MFKDVLLKICTFDKEIKRMVLGTLTALVRHSMKTMKNIWIVSSKNKYIISILIYKKVAGGKLEVAGA